MYDSVEIKVGEKIMCIVAFFVGLMLKKVSSKVETSVYYKNWLPHPRR